MGKQLKAMERMARGPIVFASVRLEPFTSMGKPLFSSRCSELSCCCTPAGFLTRGRVVFLTAVGLIIFVGGHLDEWNWWSFSNAYIAMQRGVIVIGWFLASLVMSAVVRGRATAG